eukprot:4502617-Pleurochrysis_carterae.AAC.1
MCSRNRHLEPLPSDLVSNVELLAQSESEASDCRSGGEWGRSGGEWGRSGGHSNLTRAEREAVGGDEGPLGGAD